MTCIRSLLPSALSAVRVGTVDDFQGAEFEAVVVSLVRSNPTRDSTPAHSDNGSGHAYRRRVHTAVTRAKRHVALVCDSSTMTSSAGGFVHRLITHFRLHGTARRASDIGKVCIEWL